MKANNNGSYPTSFWFFVTFGAGHVLKLVSLLPSKVMLALLNISDPKGQFIYILEDAFCCGDIWSLPVWPRINLHMTNGCTFRPFRYFFRFSSPRPERSVMGLWVMFRIIRENYSDDLEKELQKRLLFKLRSLKTGMLISSEILKTNQIDSNEPVFMINRVVKRVVLIIKMRTFPS